MSPDNHNNALVKAVQSPALARVSNQLALTDKLLTKPEKPFLIPYRKGKKWGFCDRNKNIVIDCIYQEVKHFSEGLASCKISSNNSVFIDYRGNHILEWSAKNFGVRLDSFADGLAVVNYYSHKAAYDCYSRIINKSGIPLNDNCYYAVGKYSNGLAPYKYGFYGEWGYVDSKNNVVIKPQFTNAYEFSNSLALVLFQFN